MKDIFFIILRPESLLKTKNLKIFVAKKRDLSTLTSHFHRLSCAVPKLLIPRQTTRRNIGMTKETLSTPVGEEPDMVAESPKTAPECSSRCLSRLSHWIKDDRQDIHKIFKAINRGLIITDYQGRISWVNSVTEVLTGLKRTEFVGKTLTDLSEQIIGPDGCPIPPEEMPDQRAIKEKRVIRDTVLGLRKPDNSVAWLGLTTAPLTNGKNEIETLIIILADNTWLQQAEEALQNRNTILEAVSYAAKRFLVSSDWSACLPEILERLGKAAGVSRLYLFKNFNDSQRELMTSQLFEWSVDHDLSQTENPACQVHSWYGGGMERWIPILSQGGTIHGLVKDFPETEKALLAPQGIQSILVVPVLVESQWWGFMGYDECQRERDWSSAEIDALKTAADTLGVAIERTRLDEQRRQLQEHLQDALTKVLSGYLPICAVCKKIRDEDEQWRPVDSFIRDHSELVFSHGICPDCVEKYYGEGYGTKTDGLE